LSLAPLKSPFDLQFNKSQIEVVRLDAILMRGAAALERWEVKVDWDKWKKKRRMAIEYMCRGKDSGIRTTLADLWAIVLMNGKVWAGAILIPTERLKRLALKAIMEGDTATGGDDGASKLAYIYLEDVLCLLPKGG
jgi:hypothetical protein